MSFGANPEWLRVPGWEVYPWLRAGFSTRQGGASTVYGDAELNLGWTAEDDPALVRENRSRFAAAVSGDAPPMPLVTLRQIHSANVVDLGPGGYDPSVMMADDGKGRFEGDGLVTATPGVLLGAVTADCVPVLLADVEQRVVGAFHAGWRGTVAGIVRHGVERMMETYGSRPENVRAAIGPAILTCCFEVGDEVVERFHEVFGADAGRLIQRMPSGRDHVDLQGANRLLLERAGVLPDGIATLAKCSACSRTPDGRRRFFSHRAEQGVTGRMISAIGIR